MLKTEQDVLRNLDEPRWTLYGIMQVPEQRRAVDECAQQAAKCKLGGRLQLNVMRERALDMHEGRAQPNPRRHLRQALLS
jgi:hypothetical protein